MPPALHRPRRHPWPGAVGRVLLLTCALLLCLRLPSSEMAASATAAEPAREEQLCSPEQRLDALELRIDGVDQRLDAAPQEPRGGLMTRLEHLERRTAALDLGVAAGQAVGAANGERIGELGERLEAGLRRFDPLVLRFDSLTTQVEHNDDVIQRHETRIEAHSIGLFESLMAVNSTDQAVAQLRASLARERGAWPGAADRPARVAAAPVLLLLGLLMPIGVMLFAAGHGQPPGMPPVAGPGSEPPPPDPGLRYLLAWLGAGLGYAVVGCGLMFGTTLASVVGAPFQFLPELLSTGLDRPLTEPLTRLLTALPPAGAAGLVVCSAVPDRLSPLGQLLTGFLIGALVYPLFGHWAGTAGWLAGLGFNDSGGAAGVAVLAGVTALVLAPRLGQSEAGDSPGPAAPGTGSVVGALLIWIAWLGIAPAGTPDAAALPPLLLASAAGAAGAALAVLVSGTLFAVRAGWEWRLPAGLLAGAVAAAAVHATASALDLLLLGFVTGVLYGLVLKQIAGPRSGAAAQLAVSLTVAGVCGTLAPALIGPGGFLWVSVVQLTGLGAALGLAWAAGLLLAQLPRRLAPLRPH